MNAFIVYAHPEPRSFNGAMRDVAVKTLQEQGHSVRVSDLYAMRFDPVSDRRNFSSVKDAQFFKQQQEEAFAHQNESFAPDVKAEMDKLFWADFVLFQFPLWWFSVPAILKGWVDRVFASGRIYGGGKWYDQGVLRGKRGMLALTTGGGPSIYSARGLNGDINALLFPIHNGILHFVGMDVLPPFIAWGPARADDARRRQYLDDFRQRLQTLDQTPPLRFHPLAHYDEQFQLRAEFAPIPPHGAGL